ncbi:MAG: cupin domain-containing protein [Pseudomonadota bacterium]
MRLNIDPEEFLRKHWQREPLFLAKGMANFEPPGDADELAGLALEDHVDSQIVRRSASGWTKETGPFDEASLQQTGAWSLLVQSVDHYWDSAAALLSAVSFLPSWRLDDVMMSYATDGGSAGPHFDNYDVFIIQGEGRRRWQLGQRCNEKTALLPAQDLRLIADFEAAAEFEMEQGDVLYIPPGVAHYGISLGESTSFSIGFRAPRIDALLARWVDDRLESFDANRLMQDPGRAPANAPGEIMAEDLECIREQLRVAMETISPVTVGEVVTEDSLPPSDGLSDELGDGLGDGLGDEAVACYLQEAQQVYRDPTARLAFFDDGDSLLIFANGQSHRVSLSLRPSMVALCAGSAIKTESLRAPEGVAMLQWLWAARGIVCDD